ncbi:aldo/keto reductase [Myxococcota bacterium]|nr:aldo/keto reductase [Myxococcota bacterium]
MEKRRIGNSDLEVGALGLGCNNFGMKLDYDASKAVIDGALDAGIDFFDTADMYGGTQSEEFMGRALEGRRDQVVIATKFGGLRMGSEDPWGTEDYVTECVEASLARLRTDWIDLYQIHYPDPKTPIQETLGALSKLVDQGKVRAIGCSNFSAAQLEDAFGSQSGGTSFTTLQNEWSLLQRDVETDVIPSCEKHGISVLPYFPLASGMLTGKYRRGQGFGEGTRLAVMNDYFGSFASDENFDKVEALTGFASDAGHSLLELAIGWLASHPCVGSVIAGATTPEQTQSNVAASEWRLSQEELAKVAGILGTN